MIVQDEINDLNNNQQNINRFNRRIQFDLLAEFKAYQWIDDWMPASVPEMPTPEDKVLQTDMAECLYGYPFALILTSRATGKRVWFSVYDDGRYLVQKVLSFASTTNPQFFDAVMDAYLYWIRNGMSSFWNPDVFLQKISQYTYFNWSATPCFDMRDEHAWPPAAREWSDLYLQEILHPTDEVCFSACPETAVLPESATSFSQMNITLMSPELLEPRPFLREMRKGRFLTLGFPAVSFAQAVAEQMIPSLKRADDMLIPDTVVIWAQNLDLIVCDQVSQGRRPPPDARAASLALRRMGTDILDSEQFNLGARHGLVPVPDAPPPALQPTVYPLGVLRAAHDRLVAFFTLIASRNVDAEAFRQNRTISA
ncbi:hypothetical protein QM012_005856 [Aureobasidium pullulans]|uniref:Uncharacterized protein n=1 Tax=Aureobasidium pullulans TaxID=5580 RepID=A0ABR0TQX7_AURPU